MTARVHTLGWVGAGLMAVGLVAWVVRRATPRPGSPARDYRDRSGFPGPPGAMRGRARTDFFARRGGG